MDVQFEPTVQQLEGVIGLLSSENDYLRQRIGQCGINFFHRTFTAEDLAVGRGLVTHITSTPTGTLHVHLES